MTVHSLPVAASSEEKQKRPPVKVKLERINCNYGRPCRPNENGEEWGRRLKEALGTLSSDFVEASLHQLIMAAWLPGNAGISETAVNAALAFIEGAKPRDEVEAALVIQMACTHSAAMAVLRREVDTSAIGALPLWRARPRSSCLPMLPRSRPCAGCGTAAHRPSGSNTCIPLRAAKQWLEWWRREKGRSRVQCGA